MKPEDSIQDIKGIGEKTAALFHSAGVYCVRDLIYYFPRSYKLYEQPVPVGETTEGDSAAVFCRVVSGVETRKGKRYTITTLSASDSTGSIRMLWFNSPFLRNIFHKGESYVFVGIIRIKGNMRIIEMPEYYTQFNYEKKLSTLQPVYPLVKGLTNNMVTKAVGAVRDVINEIPDRLPDAVREKYNLKKEPEAILGIHFPKDKEELNQSGKRMAFDEFLQFILDVRKMKEETELLPNRHHLSGEALSRLQGFKAGLPYSLTEGQEGALRDIISDMTSEHIMNRLIQGDVGSGKTIVAAAALYMSALSGFQGALMVPTEVLANQHFRELSVLMKPYGIRVGLLTGSMTAKQKREEYERLRSGSTDIIIGTHALIMDAVEYKNLGLVITDEQHRFGVKQRERLSSKGDMPHVLIMSATPIPRTLAIILYADLDISVINELPKGRKKIKNCVVGTEFRPSAYKFIYNEVMAGHQAYVICPMIEENETVDAENVIDYADELRRVLGNGINIEYLHGRMNEQEKNDIMNRFAAGEIQVLVATTVIEVGINNPNATVMMIENAERFGLAQLHQLRGRVGRGELQSYSIFINVKKTEESVERLKVLEESNDGFYIAAEDLKQRGPGEFFGVRQSGDMTFRVADIYVYHDMLTAAQQTVLEYGDMTYGE